MCNGLLAGLVASSSGCAVADPLVGIALGTVASLVANFIPGKTIAVGIDDPVNVVGVHAGGGLVGTIFTGFIAKERYVKDIYPGLTEVDYGIFYGGDGTLLGLQLLLLLYCIFWVVAVITPVIYVLCHLGFRVDRITEILGLDILEHTRVEKSQQLAKTLEEDNPQRAMEVQAVTAFVESEKVDVEKGGNEVINKPSRATV